MSLTPPNKVFKPVVNLIGKSQAFGVTHAAVQLGTSALLSFSSANTFVGGLLLDWTSSSLVRPRLLQGKSLQAAIDLSLTAPATSRRDTEEFLTAVSNSS